MQLLFATFGLLSAGNRVWSHVQGSKFDIPYCSLAIPRQLNVKKSLVPALSSFATIGAVIAHFSKILTQIFMFGYFSRYPTHIFL